MRYPTLFILICFVLALSAPVVWAEPPHATQTTVHTARHSKVIPPTGGFVYSVAPQMAEWFDYARRNQGPKASRLQLIATPAKSTIKAGSSALFALKLKNISKSNITIYKADYWRYYGAYVQLPPSLPGQFSMTMQERYGPPTATKIVLKPGQTISEAYEVSESFFKTEGKYRIMITRQLGVYSSKKDGWIASNIVEINVAKPEPASKGGKGSSK